MFAMRVEHILKMFMFVSMASAFHIHEERREIMETDIFRITGTTTTTKTVEVPCHNYWQIEAMPKAEDTLIQHNNTLLGSYLEEMYTCVKSVKDQHICQRQGLFLECLRDARRQTIMNLYEDAEVCAADYNITNFDYRQELMNLYFAVKYNFVPVNACMYNCILQRAGVLDENNDMKVDAYTRDFFDRMEIDLDMHHSKCQKTVAQNITEECKVKFAIMQCTYRSALKEFKVERKMLSRLELMEMLYD